MYQWIASGQGSAVLEARAGSAKTSTLAAALSLIAARPANYLRPFGALLRSSLVLAFNCHNQADLLRAISPFTAEVQIAQPNSRSLLTRRARDAARLARI